MEKEELLELIKGMREDDRKRLADSSIPAAGEERFVPVRNGRARILYYPAEAGAPVFINIHGGGFVAGVPEGDDLFCKRVNEQLKIHVVNVEYRLAPEVMFPGDKEDVYDVVSYLCGHPDEYPVDVNRMIIGGHSAGANISTAVCLMAKKQAISVSWPDTGLPASGSFHSGRAGFIRRVPFPSDSGSFNACYRKRRMPKISCVPLLGTAGGIEGTS
ncbi:MAG: alpha/beta hydrolase [Eisenbergiella sp.]